MLCETLPEASPIAIPPRAETLCLDMLLAAMWVGMDPVASVTLVTGCLFLKG